MHLKTCTRCSEEKELDEFYFYNGKNTAACKECMKQNSKRCALQQDHEYRKKRDRAYYLKNRDRVKEKEDTPVECTICHKTMRLGWYKHHLLKPNHLQNLKGITYQPPTEKSCTKCKITKPMTDFYIQSEKRDGRTSHCKDCSYETTAAKTKTSSYCEVCEVMIQDRYWATHVQLECPLFKKAAKKSIAKGIPLRKTCNTCNESKTMDQYASGIYSSQASRCKECTIKTHPPRKPRGSTIASQIAKKALEDSISIGKPLTKTCNTCNEKKTLNLYPSGKFSRFSARCTACTNESCSRNAKLKRRQLASETQSGRDQAALSASGLFNY